MFHNPCIACNIYMMQTKQWITKAIQGCQIMMPCHTDYKNCIISCYNIAFYLCELFIGEGHLTKILSNYLTIMANKVKTWNSCILVENKLFKLWTICSKYGSTAMEILMILAMKSQMWDKCNNSSMHISHI